MKTSLRSIFPAQLEKLLSLKYLLLAGILFSFGKVKSQTVGSVIVSSPQVGSAIYGTASTVTYTVTVNRDINGSMNVALSISGLPAGVTFNFNPAIVNLANGSGGNFGTSILTLTTNVSVNAISSPYIFSVIGTGNSSSASGNGTLTIDKKNLTITGLSANDKLYNANTAALINTGSISLSGVINSDIITLNSGFASGSFANKNVGSNKIVTSSGFTISGAGAGNYNLIQPTTTASITAASVSPSFTASDKVYDGLTAAAISGRSLTGVIGADVTSLTGGSATFADKNVGTAKTVTGAGFSLTGGDAGNYSLTSTSATTTADITARALTISAAGLPKVYDGNTVATVTLSDNRVGIDNITTAYLSASFATKTVGTGKAVSVTGITVTGSDAGNYTFNTTASTTANITTRALIVSATGNNKVYDGNTTATVSLSDNRVPGDILTLTNTTVTFDNKNVGTGKAVSVSGISIGGTDALNYTVNTTTTTTADITARVLIVNATGINKIYDGNATATVTLADNRVTNDLLTLNYSSATFADPIVGTGKFVSVSGLNVTGTDAGNYTFNTTASTSANITGRVLTITAAGIPKVYDGNAAATVTLGDNRVSGDIFTSAYTTSTFANKTVGTNKPVTVSGITISGANAGNYTFNTTASTTANITARALIVSATGNNKVYDGNTTATVLLGDNRVSGDLLTITNTTATFANKNVGAGKAVSVSAISVTGADAANYTFNTTTTTTADITAKSLTIVAAGINKMYDGNTTATVTLSDNRVTNDLLTLNYSTATFADPIVGTGKSVSVSGINVTGTDAGNYTFNTTASTTANITGRVLTITAAGISKIYDGTTAATVTLSDNRVSGDIFTSGYTTATFANKTVGTNKGVTVSGITISGANAGNYTFNTTASTTASITARALTVSATGNNKVYDGNTTATVLLGDNRVSGDLLTITNTTATFDNKNVGTGKAVSVSGISIGGTDALNYTVNTTTTTTADITARVLIVNATGINKIYDGNTTATVTLSDNRVAADVFTTAYANASFTTATVGIGKPVSVTGISITGTDAGNYSFNTTTSTAANITLATSSVALNTSRTVSCFNDIVILTSTINSNPIGATGSVQFFDGATSLGISMISSGTATLNVSSLSVGPHNTIRAVYSGDANYSTSSSTNISITVNELPAAYSISGTNTCQGLSTGTINLSNSVTGVIYQLLLSDGTIVQSAKTGTGSALSWNTIPANIYRVQATNNSTGCKSFTSNYIVAANPAPPAPVVTPSNPVICAGSGTPLNASGLYPNVIISEIFSGGTAQGWQQSNTSNSNSGLQSVNGSQSAGGTVEWAILNTNNYTVGSTNYTFQSPDNSKFIMANHAAENSSIPYTTTILYTPAFSTQGMINAAVKFNHTLKINVIGGNAAQPDEATIEASAGSITGPWTAIKTFSTTNAAGMEIGATNAFVLDSVVLGNSFLNQNNVYFRFVYRSKYRGWWWAMDDVSISVAPTVNYIWSQTTALYTNPAYTSPYTGSATPTVFAMPSTTTSFLVTTNISSANGCPANTTVTVTVNTPAVFSAQPTTAVICVGSPASFTAAVGGTNPNYQWQLNDGANGWVNISNVAPYSGANTITLNVATTGIDMRDHQYQLLATQNSGCISNLTSTAAKLKFNNIWTGTTSSDWNTATNWSNGTLPTLSCPFVYIPQVTNPAILSTGTALINGLVVLTNGSLTVTGATLGVATTITNVGNLDFLAGTLLLNGTTTQTIDGTVFRNKTIKHLTLNNNVNVTGSDTLKISGSLGFESLASNKTFNATTKNVSLLSTQSYTANVNEIKNFNSVLGNNFTVERFISTGVVHPKSWQLLSTAITGQSIFDSWQEKKVLRPGLGTNIPGDFASSSSFDGPAPFASMKVFNPLTNVYDGIPSTLIDLANPKGYYIFVRGDRSVTGFNDPANKTTLRSTGTLNTGNSLPNVTIPAGKFATVGNPYPSTIDLRKLYADHSTLLTFDVYVWDPNLGGAHGVGGYRTLTYLSGDYNAVPAGGFYSTISNYIQSGQAFFVKSKGGVGNINFKESYKRDTSNLATRTHLGSQVPIIQTTLNGAANGTPQVMLDGALAVFGQEYSDEVNFQDAAKFTNAGVNTGFVRSGKTLAVERRQMPTETDTLHISFTGVKQLSYTWDIKIENIDVPGLQAWLWDKFLNTKTALLHSSITNIDFGVDNNAASKAADRFKIVFTQAVILPVKITSIEAIRIDKNSIAVNWKVENENNVSVYTIERSADGVLFNNLAVQPPINNNGSNSSYNYLDVQPLMSDNYYRVKALSIGGLIQYSSKVKVEALVGPSSISVLPNPVLNKEINIVFANKAIGKYDISLTNSIGQNVYKGQITTSTAYESRKIRLTNLQASGVYQLVIISPDGSTDIQRIMIQ